MSRDVATFLSVSRLHIVCIAALGTLTFGWLFTGVHAWSLAAVAGLDWFLVNIVNRVVDLPEDRVNRIRGVDFVERHRGPIFVLAAAVLVASFAVVQLAEPALWPLRLAYHLLGVAYNHPVLPLPGGHRIRLKEVYVLKNLASAVGFLLTVFGYPLVARAAGVTVGWGYVATLAVFFLFSELSYEVVYDLRDIEGDRAAGVPTFPVVHGAAATGAIVHGLLAASASALVAGYATGAIDWRAFVLVVGLVVQLASFRVFARRGVTAGDCIALTWTGVGLLLAYNAWVLAGLPLDPFG